MQLFPVWYWFFFSTFLLFSFEGSESEGGRVGEGVFGEVVDMWVADSSRKNTSVRTT